MNLPDPAEVAQQTMYSIAAAPRRNWPFPHIMVENVFPPDFYEQLMDALPSVERFKALTETGRVKGVSATAPYSNRLIIEMSRPQPELLPEDHRDLWAGFLDWLMGERFGLFMLQQFGTQVSRRFGDKINQVRLFRDFLIVRDQTDYALGPHTDGPQKVVVMLFYLPADAAHPELGTSFYVPRTDGMVCEGNRHYDREEFLRVATMPYKPNTMVAFFKNARSFHGVEPVTGQGLERRLIQFSIWHALGTGDDIAPVPCN
jgi:hypothetical protein